MLPEAIRRLPFVNSALVFASWLQAKWFDKKHNVQTSGDMPLDQMTVTGSKKDGTPYVPVHPRAGRLVLQNLPIQNHHEYTFIDLGSGKGRMLLLAAEHPFQQVIGVEFGKELHDIAEQNIRTYRNPARRCDDIRAVHMDVREFVFPDTQLVVYIFNAFRGPLLKAIADRLDESIEKNPRDVVVVMFYPEQGHVIEAMRNVRILKETPHYTFYRSVAAGRISAKA